MSTTSKPKAWFWVVFIVLVVAVPFAVVGRQPELLRPVISARFPTVRWVDAETLAEWMARPASDGIVVLDAREADEFDVSHLQGALRIDPEQPEIDSLGLAPETTVVVYCSVGYRSGAVAETLEEAGFEDVYNLEGGIFGWANEDRPIFVHDKPATTVHPYDRAWATFLREDLRAPLRPAR